MTKAKTMGPVRRIGAIVMIGLVTCGPASADSGGVGRLLGRRDTPSSGTADRQARQQALAAIPVGQLLPEAVEKIRPIVDSPTLYRRLPIETIHCTRDSYVFLARHPDVLVGLWDLMGITNVQVQRTGPYRLRAVDGSGTTCDIDLVYGDLQTHLFLARGSYDGKLVARPVHGNGVFLLRSRYAVDADGRPTVTGTMDCFLQLENLGADLIARTFGGLIGKSADHNFRETAKFVEQIEIATETQPMAMMEVAHRLPQVQNDVRTQFAAMIRRRSMRTATGQRDPAATAAAR